MSATTRSDSSVNVPALDLAPVSGLRWGVSALAGAERPNLAIAELGGRRPLTRAVFTRNACRAAPVIVARRHLARAASPRYWLVNSGVANAGTGAAGIADATAACAALAGIAGLRAECVLPCSTGLIGGALPVDAIVDALPGARADLSADGWRRAASAIMTTDTVPKGASVRLPGSGIQMTGIAKGAGMIRPDMATMLAFIGTDAELDPDTAQEMLAHAVERSFNRITVDGDTSTNDCCALLASGDAGAPVSDAAFVEALTALCDALAAQIVADAEGATKQVVVAVSGGRDESECLKAAYAVAESLLVKTALHGADPNWGRVLAAVGRAGVPDLDPDGIAVRINGVEVVSAGARAPSYGLAEQRRLAASLRAVQVALDIELGRGAATARVRTADLSADYVRINAHYAS